MKSGHRSGKLYAGKLLKGCNHVNDIPSSAFLKDNSYHFTPFEFLFSKAKKAENKCW